MTHREFIKALRDKDRERLKAVRQADKMKRMVDFICKVADDNEAQMDAEIARLQANLEQCRASCKEYREALSERALEEQQVDEEAFEKEARRIQAYDRE